MIETKNLEIGYEKSLLSEKINLNIKDPGITVLMGANGVGKSTLLKTLAGILEPINGSVEFKPSFKLEKDLSIVLSDKIDVPYLRVKDLVSLGRYPYSNFWGQITSRDEVFIYDAIKELSIEQYSYIDYSNLSDGNKQKVLLAKALAKRPKVLFLDEPFVFLDPPAKLSLIKSIFAIVKKYQMSIVVATHDWTVVKDYFDSVYYIDLEYKLIKSTVSEIVNKKRLSHIFETSSGIIQKDSKFFIQNFEPRKDES